MKKLFVVSMFVIAFLTAYFLFLADNKFETVDIPDELKLKVQPEMIIGSKIVDGPEGKIKEYQYISQVEVQPAEIKIENTVLKEDISKRTSNAQFFMADKDENEEKWVGRFYSAANFYKKNGKWYQIKTGITTSEAFNLQTKIDFFKRFFGKKAMATDYDVGAGDGLAYYSNANWNTARTGATGSIANATNNFAQTQSSEFSGATLYGIRRVFVPINTSAIPSNATLVSGSLSVYASTSNNGDNDGEDFISVVQTSQANSTTVSTADFDTCGDPSTPIEGIDSGEREDITNISKVAFTVFTLNSTGLGWVKRSGETSNCGTTAGVTCLGLREGHDITGNAIANDTTNSLMIISSEDNETTKHPYLTVIYRIFTPDVQFRGGVKVNGGVMVK